MDNDNPQPAKTQLSGAFKRLKETDLRTAEKVFMSMLKFIAYAETKKEKRIWKGKFTFADMAKDLEEVEEVIED